MAGDGQAALELRAGALAEEDLAVTALSGREELSAPFELRVDFHQREGEPLALADLPGAETLLTIRSADGAARHVHGILWSVELVRVASGKPAYRARIVPALQRLVHVRRSRVFQQLSVPDIVAKVLKEGKVKHRLALTGSHPRRELCVQYRESDLDFVSRLLEDEGIFYFFEHGTDAHTMVLADAASAFAAIDGDGEVPYRGAAGAAAHGQEEHLTALARAARIRSSRVLLQDFDFLRPELRVEGKADGGISPPLEHVEYPGGFVDPGAGGKLAKARLEELRREIAAFTGDGTVVRLFPGAEFAVRGHPDAAFDVKLHVLALAHEATQVRAEGLAGGAGHDYRCRFEAVEPSVSIRPARRTPRPSARLETATVVGPSGEEVHTDQHGRVKVRFHWDREGKADDTASCWIRRAQAWAGPGWGALFLPRIGQEVLVRFLDGDPDRPLVAGAVYNGQHPPPVTLPQDKTRSTNRSDSSPGGNGSNELAFEDLDGSERVFLHAQRDETVEVVQDKRQSVGATETLAVDGDRTRTVGGDQALEVVGEDHTTVALAQSLTVGGARETEVVAGHQEKVLVAQSISVAAVREVQAQLTITESVGAAAALTVAGAYAVTVGGAANVAVGGALARQVGGARVEAVGARRDEKVAGDASATVGGDFTSVVDEGVSLDTTADHDEKVDGKVEVEVKAGVGGSAKEFQLEADKLFVVVGGDVVLAVDSSGNVTFGVKSLSVQGDQLTLKGSKLEKSASGQAAQKTVQVTQLQKKVPEKNVATVTVKDSSGFPLANLRWKAELPDGSTKQGKTDAQGRASIPSAKTGKVKVTFPDVDKKRARS